MLQTYDPMELSQNPYWMELLQLYNSLKKMLPEKYIQAWTSLYWTAMSIFCFQTSGHHGGEYLGPKLRPGIGFFGPHFF